MGLTLVGKGPRSKHGNSMVWTSANHADWISVDLDNCASIKHSSEMFKEKNGGNMEYQYISFWKKEMRCEDIYSNSSLKKNTISFVGGKVVEK